MNHPSESIPEFHLYDNTKHHLATPTGIEEIDITVDGTYNIFSWFTISCKKGDKFRYDRNQLKWYINDRIFAKLTDNTILIDYVYADKFIFEVHNTFVENLEILFGTYENFKDK